MGLSSGLADAEIEGEQRYGRVLLVDVVVFE